MLNKQTEDFDRRIERNTYFKNKTGKDYKTEDPFTKQKNKNLFPINNHQSIEAFIETRHDEISKEIEKKSKS